MVTNCRTAPDVFSDEAQHFCEMVVIVIDWQDGQLHPMLPFQALFCAA